MNRTMAVKNKKAKVESMKAAAEFRLAESMADIHRNRISIGKSGLYLHKSHAEFMRKWNERKKEAQ